MKDQISKDRILQLHPKVQDTFTKFIEDCESTFDIKLRIMLPVYRTIKEQNILYSQGRTTPGKIVTKAKGGESYHNYGLAIDICDVTETGEMNWNYDNSKLDPIAKKFGIEWGGDWTSIKDRPHFQISFGYKWHELFLMDEDEKGYPKIP